MNMSAIENLYNELDHLDGAEYIIDRTVKACADVLGNSAANDPDARTQRRTVLSDTALQLRLATTRSGRTGTRNGKIADNMDRLLSIFRDLDGQHRQMNTTIEELRAEMKAMRDTRKGGK